MYCIVLVFLLNILCYKHSIGNCIVLVMYSNPMQIPPLHLSCHRYYQLLWAKRQTTLPLSSSGKGRKKKRLLIKNFTQITKLVSFPSVSLLIFIQDILLSCFLLSQCIHLQVCVFEILSLECFSSFISVSFPYVVSISCVLSVRVSLRHLSDFARSLARKIIR